MKANLENPGSAALDPKGSSTNKLLEPVQLLHQAECDPTDANRRIPSEAACRDQPASALETGSSFCADPELLQSGAQEVIACYERAIDYLDRQLIQLTPRRKAPLEKVRAALSFNEELGNPQRCYPSVQVAGTSGKGSSAYLLAQILHHSGYRTGLHISPYLQIATEKSWVSGNLIQGKAFGQICDIIRPVADRFKELPDLPASVHGMASLALSYLHFAQQDVQIAVIETGLGGRHDLVQGLKREISVITEIGLDHQEHLGPDVNQIAWHKAGIIEPGVPSVAMRSLAHEVIEAEASSLSSPLRWVDESPLGRLRESWPFLVLDLHTLGTIEVKVDHLPRYQLRNALVAAEAADALAQRGWRICPQAIASQIRDYRFPGRMEVVQEQPTVILDAAHNPQKMAALASSLPEVRGRLVMILALTGERAVADLLSGMDRKPDLCVCTQAQVYGKKTPRAEDLALAVRSLGLAALAIPTVDQALDHCLPMLDDQDLLVVSGSIYLVGEARGRWYDPQRMLIERDWWAR